MIGNPPPEQQEGIHLGVPLCFHRGQRSMQHTIIATNPSKPLDATNPTKHQATEAIGAIGAIGAIESHRRHQSHRCQPPIAAFRRPPLSTAIHLLAFQQFRPCWACQLTKREYLFTSFFAVSHSVRIEICARIRSAVPSFHPNTFQLNTFGFKFTSNLQGSSLHFRQNQIVLGALSPAASSTSILAVISHQPTISRAVP